MSKLIQYGITATDQNHIREEVKSIFSSGNACYHAMQNLCYQRNQRNVKFNYCCVWTWNFGPRIKGRTQVAGDLGAAPPENSLLLRCVVCTVTKLEYWCSCVRILFYRNRIFLRWQVVAKCFTFREEEPLPSTNLIVDLCWKKNRQKRGGPGKKFLNGRVRIGFCPLYVPVCFASFVVFVLYLTSLF